MALTLTLKGLLQEKEANIFSAYRGISLKWQNLLSFCAQVPDHNGWAVAQIEAHSMTFLLLPSYRLYFHLSWFTISFP